MFDRKISSPSRTYVAVCNEGNWNGFYFQRFTLPEDNDINRGRVYGDGTPLSLEQIGRVAAELFRIRNDSEYASWFFLSHINHMACIAGCVTAENFADVTDVGLQWQAEAAVS